MCACINYCNTRDFDSELHPSSGCKIVWYFKTTAPPSIAFRKEDACQCLVSYI